MAFAGTASALLSCWEADPRSADAALRAAAGAACRQLRGFAARFPIGRPAAHFHDGVRQALLGRRRRAARRWRLSLRSAGQLGLPYDAAAAHFELGRHLGGDVGHIHLEQSRAAFESLGVVYDAARARAAAEGR